jgi:group I intron endonuclease
MHIYYIKNNKKGKGYVGQHCGDTFTRWKSHMRSGLEKNPKLPLYRAMKRDGLDSFTYEKLETIPNEKGQLELDLKEIYWIHEKNTYVGNRNGYNLTFGGLGGSRIVGCNTGSNEKLKKFTWGKYDLDGNLLGAFETASEAAKSLNLKNFRGIYDAASWHEMKGKKSKIYGGFMWKRVPKSLGLPKKITPLQSLDDTFEDKRIVEKNPLKGSSRKSSDYEIAQYDFNGNLIKVWPNNAEKIGQNLNIDGDSIRKNLRGETLLTGGYHWRRNTKNTSPIKISAIPTSELGFKLDNKVFYNEPILKIDNATGEIIKKYDSISRISAPFIEQLRIYVEANQNYNYYDDYIKWVFEKNLNKEKISVIKEIYKIKMLIKEIC